MADVVYPQLPYDSSYPRPLKHLEVWSDSAFSTSTGVARIGMVPVHHLAKAEDYAEINGDDRLHLTIASSCPGSTIIDHGVVLRPVFNTPNSSWAEYRARVIDTVRSQRGVTKAITAYGVKHDLATNSPLLEFAMPATTLPNAVTELHFELLDLTPEEHFDVIFGTTSPPSYFSKGSFSTGDTITRRYDLIYHWDTPYSAMQEIAVLSNGELYTVQTSTGYTVNLTTQLNSTVAPVLVSYARNAVTARRTEDSMEQGTWVYPQGGGPQGFEGTISELWWELLAIGGASTSSTAVTINGMWTLEVDQLENLYLKVRQPGEPAGGVHKIVASDWAIPFTTRPYTNDENRTTLYFNSSDAPDLPTYTDRPRYRGQLCKASDGTPLNYIPLPSAVTEYGVRPMVAARRDIPAISNWVQNAFCSTWSAGWQVSPTSSCEYWLQLDVTGSSTQSGIVTLSRVAQPDPHIKYGGSVLKVVSTGDGKGMCTSWHTYPEPSSDLPHLSFQTSVYVESGKVRVELHTSSGPTGQFYNVNFSTWPGTTGQAAKTEAIETAHHIAVAPGAENFWEQNVVAWRGAIVAHGGPATYYIDAAQVVNKPAPAEQIVVGDFAWKLWNAGMQTLEKAWMPQEEYNTDMINLHGIAPDVFPHDALALGGKLHLYDEDIGINTTKRIYSRRRDLLVGGSVKVEFD